jgi:hypothetical protein
VTALPGPACHSLCSAEFVSRAAMRSGPPRASCPLHPRQRTYGRTSELDAKCQEGTFELKEADD